MSTAPTHRLFGAEMSPYSVKVRAYLRFKGIRHQWIPRNAASQAEYEKYAKVPIIPLLVTPRDVGIQDSTPIIEALEAAHPTPGIHPDEPVSDFVSALLEEFGDEWGNKWMFHYRWARDVDRVASAGRLARMREPMADDASFERLAIAIRTRMVDRVWFVGSSESTAPLIEQSFRDAISLLDAHLRERPYLFGHRPSFGDFGLWGQLYCAWTDPTPGALIEGRAPHLLDWIQRMLWPRVEGEFEPWDALEPTLLPLLRTQVGQRFLPWSRANARALAEERQEFTVRLAGGDWTQKPQKYHAKSLQALCRRYASRAGDARLAEVLTRAGCLDALAISPGSD